MTAGREDWEKQLWGVRGHRGRRSEGCGLEADVWRMMRKLGRSARLEDFDNVREFEELGHLDDDTRLRTNLNV